MARMDRDSLSCREPTDDPPTSHPALIETVTSRNVEQDISLDALGRRQMPMGAGGSWKR